MPFQTLLVRNRSDRHAAARSVRSSGPAVADRNDHVCQIRPCLRQIVSDGAGRMVGMRMIEAGERPAARLARAPRRAGSRSARSGTGAAALRRWCSAAERLDDRRRRRDQRAAAFVRVGFGAVTPDISALRRRLSSSGISAPPPPRTARSGSACRCRERPSRSTPSPIRAARSSDAASAAPLDTPTSMPSSRGQPAGIGRSARSVAIAHVLVRQRVVVDAGPDRRLHVLQALDAVHRRIGLDGDQADVAAELAQPAADAHERAARAEPGDEVRDAARRSAR